MKNPVIREWKETDAAACADLMRKAVLGTCGKGYTAEQCAAWAAGISAERIASLLREETALAAEADGQIAGFGSVTADGCLDLLYVLPEMQHRGIAAMLCDALEIDREEVLVYASVCARKFFSGRGYGTVRKETVFRCGTALDRYEMRLVKGEKNR